MFVRVAAGRVALDDGRTLLLYHVRSFVRHQPKIGGAFTAAQNNIVAVSKGPRGQTRGHLLRA